MMNKTIEQEKRSVWMHMENPTEEQLRSLVRAYNVEEDLLRDALDPFEVSRFHEEGGKQYLFLEVPCQEGNGEIGTHPILAVLGNGKILTVSQRSSRFTEKIFSGEREIVVEEMMRAFLNFLSLLNDEYAGYVTKIAKEVRAVSSDVTRVRVEDLTRFVRFEKAVNDFTAALVPMRTALRKLFSEKRTTLSEENAEFVEDVFLGVEQLIELSESTHKHIVNIREAASVVMTHRLNQSIKTLTMITVVLSVPMVLGSLFGMNVPLPLASESGVFWGIIGASLFTMVGMVVWLNRGR